MDRAPEASASQRPKWGPRLQKYGPQVAPTAARNLSVTSLIEGTVAAVQLPFPTFGGDGKHVPLPV